MMTAITREDIIEIIKEYCTFPVILTVFLFIFFYQFYRTGIYNKLLLSYVFVVILRINLSNVDWSQLGTHYFFY